MRNTKQSIYVHIILVLAETKGGYLVGNIVIPNQLFQPVDHGSPTDTATKDFLLRISLVPAYLEPDANPFNIHPLLLYMNSRQNRKNRQSKVFQNTPLPCIYE